MKKSIVFILLVLVFVGCATMMFGTKYVYQYELVKPASKDMSFTDENIQIKFTIGEKSVGFTLKNVGSTVLKVLWDEANIVQNGAVKKTFHVGVKYSEKNNSQPPSTIPPNATLDDQLTPTENAHYVSGQYGGWDEYDLFPTTDFNKEETKKAILDTKGTTFSVYIPVKIDDKTKDYLFEFKVIGVAPKDAEK